MTTLLTPISEQNPGRPANYDEDVEPDTQWKENLRARIEKELQSMADKVREDRDAQLKGISEGTAQWEAVMKAYNASMDRVRRLAGEQFSHELKIARFERSLALGKEVEGEEFEAFRRQQQAIWDTIKKGGGERPQQPGRRDSSVVSNPNQENGDPVPVPPRASGEHDAREGPSMPHRDSRPLARAPPEPRPRDRTQSGGSDQILGTPGSYGARSTRSRGNSSVFADFDPTATSASPSPYEQGSIGRQGGSSLSRTKPQDIWLPSFSLRDDLPATSRTYAHATAPTASPISPNVRDGPVNDNGRTLSRAGSIRSNERPSPATDYEPGSSLPRDRFGMGSVDERTSSFKGKEPERPDRPRQPSFTQQTSVHDIYARRSDSRTAMPITPSRALASQTSEDQYFPQVSPITSRYRPDGDDGDGIPIRSSRRSVTSDQGSPENMRYGPPTPASARPIPSKRSFTGDFDAWPAQPSSSTRPFFGPQSPPPTVSSSRPIPRPSSAEDDHSRHSPSGAWHGSQSPPNALPFIGHDIPFSSSPRYRYSSSPAASVSSRRNSNGGRSLRSRSSRQEFWGPSDVSQRPLPTFEEQSVASDSDSDEDYGMDLDDLWHTRERRELAWKLIRDETRRQEREGVLRKAEEARRLEEEARRKEEEARKKEEEARRKEAEARQKAEEAHRKEEEVRLKALEIQQKQEELARRELELLRRETEAQLQEERRKREEAEARLQEEIRRREAEEEARKREREEADRRAREEAERREREAMEREERERKEKEEREKKEREEREIRLRQEKEEQERQERLDRQKREKEERERKAKEARERKEKEKREREERERLEQEERKEKKEKERREKEERERQIREQKEREEWKRQQREEEDRFTRQKQEWEETRRRETEAAAAAAAQARLEAERLQAERAAALEAQRQREDDARREAQRRREADAQRQRDIEARRQQEEIEAQQREIEAQQQQELEAQREAEVQRQRETEAQRQQEAEAQKQREAVARRRREAEAKQRDNEKEPADDIDSQFRDPHFIKNQQAELERIQAETEAKRRMEAAAKREEEEAKKREVFRQEQDEIFKRIQMEEQGRQREQEARRRAEDEMRRKAEQAKQREDAILADVMRRSEEEHRQKEERRRKEDRKRQDSVGSASESNSSRSGLYSTSASSSAPRPIPNSASTFHHNTSVPGDRSSTASSSSLSSSASFFSASSGRSNSTGYTSSASRASATPNASATPTGTPGTPNVSSASRGWKPAASPVSPGPTSASSATGRSSASAFQTAFSGSAYAQSSPSTARPAASYAASSPPDEEEWARRQEEHARRQFEQFQREQEAQQRRAEQKAMRQLSKEDVIKLFEEHERRWARIASMDMLSWHSFPWPMLKQPSDPEQLTYIEIQAYVLSPHQPADKTPKERIKDYLRKWHPDRFETKVLPRVREDDREMVKEGAGAVARHLNKLLGSLSGSAENGLFG